MSQIRQMYTNLAAKVVSFTRENGASVSLAAKDLHQVQPIQQADAPVRLLLRVAVDSEMRDGMFASLDTIGRQDWYITDLFLLQQAPLGAHISDMQADIVRYEAAYAEMLRTMRTMGIATGDVELLSWRSMPRIYDWPIGSDSWWYGTMMTLRVLEVMSS